ncbi:MAG: hypothetical protein ACR2K3_11560 [Nocardioides sp.]
MSAEGSSLGKPVPASLTRRFDIDSGTNPSDVLAEAAHLARSNRWTQRLSTPTAFNGAGTVDGRSCSGWPP